MRVLGTETTHTARILTGLFSGFLAMLVLTSSAIAQDTNRPDTLLTQAQWKSFEANVAEGIRSDNPGVRESALGQIAKFGTYMDFNQDDVITVVRIYRDGGVFRNRQLAITAIGQMDNRWGIEFLDMLRATETSPQLQKTIADVVDAYWAENGGNPYKDM
jgi:hypothetical protein